MTMDYGASKAATQTMYQASVAAAHTQLQSLYRQAGLDLGSDTTWCRLGLTPMIGQNDTAGEIFTLADAASLNQYAKSKGIGRLSLWSLNRDRTCGSNYPDVTTVSTSCSGVNQGNALYSSALGADVIPTTTPETPATPTPAPAMPTDDPATSPYPVWKETATYVAGDRSVWHGNVYEAKWWTQKVSPQATLDGAPDSPWIKLTPAQLQSPTFP